METKKKKMGPIQLTDLIVKSNICIGPKFSLRGNVNAKYYLIKTIGK